MKITENVSQRFKDVDYAGLPTEIYHLAVYLKTEAAAEEIARPSQVVSKITTTRCNILRLKCTKFDFSWGSAHWGAHSAPQTQYQICGDAAVEKLVKMSSRYKLAAF